MSAKIQKKIEEIEKIFRPLKSAEEKYHALMDLGKTLAPYPEDLKTEDRVVHGCQSIVYLDAKMNNGQLHFQIFSDALISSGLAALLLHVYNDQSPEDILKISPDFIAGLGITASLSPGRSNGLASMFLRIKKETLKLYMNNQAVQQ